MGLRRNSATFISSCTGDIATYNFQPLELYIDTSHVQRIVVAGAGSAGSGVILTIRNAMNKRYGLTKEEASSRFFIVDKDGLISKHRWQPGLKCLSTLF